MSRTALLKVVALPVLLCFHLPATGHSVPINTGNGLLAHCSTESADQLEVEHHLGQCIGFIKGVGNAWAIEHPKDFCLRPGLDNAQMRDIVVAYLERFPAIRDQASAFFVITAMREAFPCTAKK